MHQFNIKEQLVLLKINRLSYKGMKQYLLYQFQRKTVHQTKSFNEIQQCISYLKDQFLLENNFKIETIPIEEVVSLAKHCLIYGEKVYPKNWYHIEQPPVLIFYQGHLDLLNKPCISVVGTRNITSYGKQVTQKLVRQFSNQNWSVVSGMAKGVDAVVHETAMTNKNSLSTIAIIATGLNRVYPKEHRQLQDQMAASQLVLTEYLPNQPALKHHFIMRNRLVAGLSPVICVIEAASKSGSLITANYALQFNREVYALPGRISDLQSSGCNELIEAGARPIISIEKVSEEIKELLINQHYINK